MLVTEAARYRQYAVYRCWHTDETDVKVKGQRVYLYRVFDKFSKTPNFKLSKRSIKTATTQFSARALEVNGLPRKIVIDKSGASTVGTKAINNVPQGFGC